MRELTNETWDLNGKATVLVVSAKWCGPCRKMVPVIEELEFSMGQRVEWLKADADKCSLELKKMGIMSVPTVVLFINGREVGRWIGFTEKSKLKTRLEEKLKSSVV